MIWALFPFSALNGGHQTFWVGLTNPDGVACTNSGCSSLLKWADGRDFVWDPAVHSFLMANSATFGYGYSFADGSFQVWSENRPEMFACVSECSSERKRESSTELMLGCVSTRYHFCRICKYVEDMAGNRSHESAILMFVCFRMWWLLNRAFWP